jgi:hypothetical protein
MEDLVVLVVEDQVVQELLEVLEIPHQYHHHKVIMVLAAPVLVAVEEEEEQVPQVLLVQLVLVEMV